MGQPGPRADVLVLTAIETEYQAVRSHVVEPRRVHHQHGTIFEVGTVRGTACRVAVVLIGDGNLTAATLAERANALFTPKATLFVGVGGGLRDEVALGDVVVGTWVYNHHSGKESPDGFHPRARAWEGSHQLLQLARHVARTGSWEALAPGSRDARVHFAPIVAGEVVVDHAGSAVRSRYDDAAAVTMEDAGMMQADHLGTPGRSLAIRGVSDRADGTKSETDAGQPDAAVAAAAFAIALIAELGRLPADRGGWLTRRRPAIAAAAPLLLFAAFAYYAVRLALDSFYGALGAEPDELPVGVLDMVGPLLFVTAVCVGVTAVALGALVLGAALLPRHEPTRTAIPAAALATTLILTTFCVLAFMPDALARTLGVVVLGMFTTGLVARASKQKTRHIWVGVGGGVAAAALAFVLAVTSARVLPGPWPLVLFCAGLAAAVAFFGLWSRREMSRRPAGERADTTPAALLRQAWTDIMPSSRDFRGAAPSWRANRIVAGSLVALTAVAAAALWGMANWIDGRVEAGRAALDLGYVPAAHSTLTLPTPVRPATITPHRPASDPLAVCERPTDRAASLLASDGGAYWVLLRPVGDGAAPATVIRLSSTDYTVRPVPDSALPADGTPWTGPACTP